MGELHGAVMEPLVKMADAVLATPASVSIFLSIIIVATRQVPIDVRTSQKYGSVVMGKPRSVHKETHLRDITMRFDLTLVAKGRGRIWGHEPDWQ